jgi:ferric-dicitrate binding protein FerR (iron transport regulator)
MNYTQYTVEDFVLDRNFHQWVTHPDTKSDAFWEIWQYQNPDKVPLLNQARDIILNRLQVLKQAGEHERLSDDRMKAMWSAIQVQASLSEEKYIPAASDQVSRFRFRHSHRWAAVIAFIVVCLGAAASWVYQGLDYEYHSTNYGETKKITLPDGSVVILNANSTIQYRSSWPEVNKRCVWLEGEAFFDVVRSPEAFHPKFIVLTGDLNIEVLGTQFNVFKREAQTSVTLQEGKVTLDIPGTNDEKILMKPGEQVVFSSLTRRAVRKIVKAENVSSWTNNLWILDNTSLLDVAKQIETIYGKNVIIQDTELYRETISGVLPAKNFDSMLEILSTLYSIRIKVKDNQIIIYK